MPRISQFIQYQIDMQKAFQNIRNTLWNRLKCVFSKYAREGEEIPNEKIEDVIRDVLEPSTKDEIDYVLMNMFKLDSDLNGGVSFRELGNFLFERHCGEMSLRKMHRDNQIKYGGCRKITQEEFWILLNRAYSFLNVECPRDICNKAFAQYDTNCDGLITYEQYFQFIRKYIRLNKSEYHEYSPCEWNSKLRQYMWTSLKSLFCIYVGKVPLKITDDNLRGLISCVLGSSLTCAEMNFILGGLYTLRGQNIEFKNWASQFLFLVAQVFLGQFQRNHNCNYRTLTVDEFIILLRNSFKFLKLFRVRREVFIAIFNKIDTNNNGLILYSQYLKWFQSYICVEVNIGKEYYTKEDDAALYSEDCFFDFEICPIIPVIPPIVPDERVHFKFSDFGLAKRVRERVHQLLITFDSNRNKRFSEQEIRNSLKCILNENQYEILDVVRNAFLYDRDNDKIVTYDELTNFFVEKHLGEMSIQRLHRVGAYSKGDQRIMNQEQFAFTINNALDYIPMRASESQMNRIWCQIDINRDGWITYEAYFRFLSQYFGNDEVIPKPRPPCIDEQDEKWKNSMMSLQLLDRFTKWILDQLQVIFKNFDFSQRMIFESQKIEYSLKVIFRMTDTEIQFVMSQYFKYESRRHQSFTFEEFTRILISIYFIFFRLRNLRDRCVGRKDFGKMNLNQFLDLVRVSTFYMRIPYLEEDLTAIFHIIDTNGNGWITYSEYMNFILKNLGSLAMNEIWDEDNQICPDDNPDKKPSDVDDDEWDFICCIWRELKCYFDQHDICSKSHLNYVELRKFLIEVLEESESEVKQVMWNMFKADPNNDRKIQFHEFAPFVLKHTAAISLQRFHRNQTIGKRNLTEFELFIVFSQAFCFLKTMPKSQRAVSCIYKRMGRGCDPSYKQYFEWIDRALAQKFRK